VVPLDGSAVAEQALGPACALATTLGVEVQLVGALDPPSTFGMSDLRDPTLAGLSGPNASVVETVRYLDEKDGVLFAGAQRYLEGQAGRLRAAGHAVSLHTAFGPPALVIGAAAHAANAAAIVMATHGRGGLARLALGSTTEEVLRESRQPLLVIRPTAAREQAPVTAPVADVAGRSAEPSEDARQVTG
jgi:nucleotide-binding universal stress UspA family protein